VNQSGPKTYPASAIARKILFILKRFVENFGQHNQLLIYLSERDKLYYDDLIT
jgi:hypothetical protein